MLALSLALGLASAVAYGCSTAVQHAAAYDASGRSHAAGLLGLLRNVRWWLSLGGDGLGLVFQVAALATGPVVLVQPLQVLALPVALPVRAALGGPRPTRRDGLAAAAVVVGVVAFLLLVGDPGAPRELRRSATLATAAVALGGAGLLVLLALRRSARVRSIVFGALGGILFAVVAVTLDEVSETVQRDGFDVLWRVQGAVLLVAIVVVGGVALGLTQAAFQVGGLGASYTAGAALDPLVSVVLGAALLGERLPLDPGHLAGYLVAFAVVVAGTIGLSTPRRQEDVTIR